MSFWTKEKIELLKKYWADGFSASEIEQKIGATSRSAVIGKVHRLGLAQGKGGRKSGPKPRIAATDPETKRAGYLQSEAQRDRQRRPHVVPRTKGTLGDIPLPETKPVIPTVNVHPKVCGLPAALLNRAEGQCCFPVGEPKSPGFHYCTNERLSVKRSYCVSHQKIMDGKGAPAKTPEWYEQRRAWAEQNPTTQMGRDILKYFGAAA